VASLPTAEKFPTNTQPVPTSTNTPLPTATARPTNTQPPTVVPSPTNDLRQAATEIALDLAYQQGLTDIRRQNSQIFWDDIRNLGYFLSFLIVLIGATAIIIQAYRRKPKPVQNDVSAAHSPTQATGAENVTPLPPMVDKAIMRLWSYFVEKTSQGVVKNEASYYQFFSADESGRYGQSNWRKVLAWLELNKMFQLDENGELLDGQRALDEKFYNWLGQ
jgi:hypothetical protein